MKKIIIIIFIILAVMVSIFFISRMLASNAQAKLIANLETVVIERSTLATTVSTAGTVRSSQSALLFWETSGEVSQVLVKPGDQVSAGDILAVLETGSLPAYIILAQTDLLSAQKALDDLYNSQSQQAAALKAVDEAEKALEDALNPEWTQAQAQAEVAKNQKNLEVAQRNYKIISAIPPQSAIDQAYANLLLAEDQLKQTKDAVADLEQQIKTAGIGLPPEFQEQIRRILKKALKSIQIKLTQDQLAYERSLARYNALLTPPDPIEVGVAEAELTAAKAQLEEAKRTWERVKDGPSLAEIAVLEAKLSDAKREWERVKDGPDPDNITILETQIAIAQATINTMRITAPFDGTVSAVQTQASDQVNPGTLAFRIDDVSQLLVDVNISEIDINQIEIGQDAILTFESVFAKEYHGKVVETAPVGTKLAGAVTFKVSVELLDPDDNIKPGMTSEVNIVISQIENALLVPSQAIRLVDGEKVVYVLDRGFFDGQSPARNSLRPIPVTLGVTSNNFSEVIAGSLNPGDEVLIDPPDELLNQSQGSRISVRIGN
jgi:HlyD family secretion protein